MAPRTVEQTPDTEVTDPNRIAQMRYAEDHALVDTDRVERTAQLLADAIGSLPGGYDPNNPGHVDLRNRWIGASAALGARTPAWEDTSAETADSKTGKDDDDIRPRLRNDRGIDYVRGTVRNELWDNPDPSRIVQSVAAPVIVPPAQKIADPLSESGSYKQRRQVM
jgi:hypothetical protein